METNSFLSIGIRTGGLGMGGRGLIGKGRKMVDTKTEALRNTDQLYGMA